MLKPLAKFACWLVSVLLLVAAGMTPADLQAGCQYATSHKPRIEKDPRGHVRDFQFLGQWIYERGDIKYVPWQSDEPCDGPDCQARKDLPAQETFAPPTSVRVPVVLLGMVLTQLADDRTPGSLVLLENERPHTGYPHQFEYPP